MKIETVPGAPLLAVRNLKVHFPGNRVPGRARSVVKAVDDLSFDLHRGETLGVVGESGCGKSTTGMAVQGLVDVTAGSINLDGVDLVSLSSREVRKVRGRTQMVFQDPTSSLNTRMTIGQILEEPLLVHQIVPPQERATRVRELLDLVGMPDYAADRYPHEFSGGQRQRVAIARALAVEPDLIVCDEPLAALDVSIRAQMLNLLRELQRTQNVAFLFISHDLSAVYHLSDRILVMYLGRAMELTDRESLYYNTRHPYTKALLSAIAVPDPDIEQNRERILLSGDVPSPMNPPSGCVFRTRCPIAQEVCASNMPEWKDIGVGETQHFVACHFGESDINAELVLSSR
ncbi:ABC transporter ATP-binding protein [Rhodococcus sp. NPDC060176]|uniref:ABC transporter ATP-binding protein n=1 Tax=Rhodococcus sp. NPDC060176 TaxID=3347062 RepID=UPI00364BEA5B